MEKYNELIAFIKTLPPEETRIFENSIVKYATNNSTIEDEVMVESIINQETDEKIKYAAFYCLNAMLRRKKDFYLLKAVFDKYPQFKSHLTYNHLWLMYQIEAELFYDYDEILKMAYNLSQNINQHAGIVHILPATFTSICEACDEESKKHLLKAWYEKSLVAANRAIDLEPDYAKFYCTKARVLAINNDFSEASLLIKRSIALEDSGRKDYALRISSYQYFELLIKMQEQKAFFSNQLEKYNIIKEPSLAEVLDKPLANKDDAPFIFVSYAHADSEIVFPLIKKMKEWGYRIWYDEGIAFGSEFNEYIADQIVKATNFILFASNAAMTSKFVRKEVNFAISCEKEPLIIYLQETFLSAGMKMQFNPKQAIMYYLIEDNYLKQKIGERLSPETNNTYQHERFQIIESICEKGGSKPNEDAIYSDEYSVLVFDGSTSLKENNKEINAVWYVEHFKRQFAKQDKCLDLKTILRKCLEGMHLEVVEKINPQYDFNNNLVCASFAGIHLYKQKLEIYTLSDCTIKVYLKNKETLTFTVKGGLRDLDKMVLDRMQEIHEQYQIDISDLRHNPEIEKMLIDNRLKMNKSDNYWTMAFDPKAIEHGTYEIIDPKLIDAILIHSDGFDMFEDKLTKKPVVDLATLYKKLRKEENNDSKCNNYPRFKVSDDATIILIEFN